MVQPVVIIGGGIAGLTCAHQFHEHGIPLALLEQSAHVGGCIHTLEQRGYLLELGPNTFLNSSTELWKLAEDVGLKDLKVETDPHIGNKRYIYKKDCLIPVPAGPKILFSKILSLKSRLRLLKEPFILPKRTPGDESLASFVKRRLGEEILNTLVTPFVSGIYAGDPERLSLKAIFPKLAEAEERCGSIFKGMKYLKGEIRSDGLGSFRAGIGCLPTAIEARLGDRIIKEARVIEIERLNGTYNIKYELNGDLKNILTKTLICATPAYSAAQLLGGINPRLKELLSGIEYAPIVVVHTGFKKEDIPQNLDGFGFLVPRLRMLGSLWSSSLFKERAPDGKVLLTTFIGGMLDSEACDLQNDEIMRIILKDLSRALGIKNRPDFASITRYSHAIPQYNIGHCKRIGAIKNELARLNGLHLTGSYFTGISVAATIEHANKVAKEIIYEF